MPIQGVASEPVYAALRQRYFLAGVSVELFTIAELIPQPRAVEEAVPTVDAEVAAVVQGVHVGAEQQAVVEAVLPASG